MRLRFAVRASEDLIGISHYIRERNPAAASKVRDAVLRTVETLVLFPEIGRRQSAEGVRKIATRRYPYVIYYTLDSEAQEIVILTIQHAARERDYIDI